MVKLTSLLVKAGSVLGFSFRVRAWIEMEIWCVKGMYRLKKNFKGLTDEQINTTKLHSSISFLHSCV